MFLYLSALKKISSRNIFILLTHFSNNWSISRKISYGYTLVISTALIGTTSASLIAYYYEQTAYKQLNIAHQQQDILKDLEYGVTRARLHPQRLVPVLEDSIWLELEKNKFLDDTNEVNQKLSELENFINIHSTDLALNIQDYQNLLKNYRDTTKSYSQSIKKLWDRIEANQSPKKETQSNLNQLVSLLKQKEYINLNIKFEKLSDELIRIIEHTEIQQQQANASFNSAHNLRVQVIAGSILLSTAIAATLAIFTSKLIARPLQTLTNVAKKITQESNFQLRSDIRSNDEVGILANSLNQLVEWVGDYTQELELARQNLEQRVEKRTLELQQAHQNLEQRVEERTLELQQALQELKNTQGQLIQTEKMSSLGQMVAGIAHEINNPVNFIYGNIECTNNYIEDLLNLLNLYQQEYPEPNSILEEKIEEIDFEFISKDISKMLFSMKIGTQRIREIVLSLRNFSRLDESDIKDVDIHEGIDSTLLILNHRLKLGVEVIKSYGDLPLIECYPAQLNQIFMNILNNAIDALLDYTNKVNKQILISTSKLDDHYIKIEIADNGPGIAPEIITKLFDPFFTTKPVGKGTGLGLSICYQIIEKHKGKIEVTSEVSQGTKFAIALPIKTPVTSHKI